MREADDRRRHFLHVLPAVLRADGDHLEERAPLLRRQEKPRRVQHQDRNHHHDRLHSRGHPGPGAFHLPRRRRLPLVPGPHLPRGDRDRHLLGPTQRPRPLQLGPLEEHFPRLLRDSRLPNGFLRQYSRYNPR